MEYRDILHPFLYWFLLTVNLMEALRLVEKRKHTGE